MKAERAPRDECDGIGCRRTVAGECPDCSRPLCEQHLDLHDCPANRQPEPGWGSPADVALGCAPSFGCLGMTGIIGGLVIAGVAIVIDVVRARERASWRRRP
jgi:hypothetical protein